MSFLPVVRPPMGAFRDVLLLTFLLLLTATAIAYPTFDCRPMGDDFGMPLYASLNAHRDGLLSLLRPSQAVRYRPLEAITMFAFEQLPLGSILLRVRALHLVSFGLYLLAALDLARRLGLGRGALIVMGCAIALHPVQVACYGGMDNFSVHVLFAVMFFGAARLLPLDGRPVAVALVTFFTTLVAACYKEYGFGTALLAPVVVYAFHAHRPTRAAIVAFVAGGIGVLLHQGLRRCLMPENLLPASPETGGRLLMTLTNVVLYAAGSTLYGSTLDLMTTPGLGTRLLCVAAMLLFVLALAVGLLLLMRAERAARVAATPHPAGNRPGMPSTPRWTPLVFVLLVCIVPLTFPNVVILRISEVYLPGVVAVVSMLCGLAFVGYAPWLDRPRVRWPLVAVAGLLVGLAVRATSYKAVGLREVGLQAQAILTAIDRAVPATLRQGRIAVLYLDAENRAPTYSVFRANDAGTCTLPDSLRWYRPSTRIELVSDTIGDPASVDPSRFDMVLLWHSAERNLDVLKGATPSALNPQP